MGASPTAKLRAAWQRLSPLPGGKRLFSRIFGTLVPYTGTLGAVVEELGPGYARLSLRDRRGVRNHLNSVHAIALANLGEATSGLAMNFALPADARAIVTGLSINYVKKARGTLTAECHAPMPEGLVPGQDVDHAIEAVIKDATGDVVATLTAQWRIGLKA